MKTTRATIKSFIKRGMENNNLYIKNLSDFNGNIDCVKDIENSEFEKIEKTEGHIKNTLGISKAWFVGQSRDLFQNYANNEFIGYKISNCCGSFIIAMKRLYQLN